jgi:chromosome segregation ATPase
MNNQDIQIMELEDKISRLRADRDDLGSKSTYAQRDLRKAQALNQALNNASQNISLTIGQLTAEAEGLRNGPVTQETRCGKRIIGHTITNCWEGKGHKGECKF